LQQPHMINTGNESVFSDVLTYKVPDQVQEPYIDDGTNNDSGTDSSYFMEDFQGYVSGNDPADWFDTKANNSMIEDNNLFKVYTIDNNNVFGTTSTLSNIHSHFMGPNSADLSCL
jgi:hypothetical protein